mmetsp:Transcript_48159/g.114500  ORF Transcript_48159/g.114500 Transcript_48159/m.114500 type:complete len:93 (+) Transcript_48159:1-279(+)
MPKFFQGIQTREMRAHHLLTKLDEAPWEWGSTGGWSQGMPKFFQGMPGAGSDGVYYNIYDELDTSPVEWHITEPVDPTMYQEEWLGSVINIY